jgi:Raf kinase inhibitor-like YbhB/YbcL family protein
MAVTTEVFHVESLAFSQGEDIPKKYTCEGENVNPPLQFSDLPEETKTLAVIVEDPDAPNGTFTHWVAWNISPNKPITESNTTGVNGLNSFGSEGYGGPCPPSGSHRYYFKIYALDAKLDLPAGSKKEALQQAMEGHILASGELMGRYKKES